ncbi:MAG TPA: alpha/beta hydrolase [Candidatus Baltobacteraceae bacterium]|nr:alpha/beta hydrolase [Candidatus Baltobacteraceae bacterium]
MTEFSAGIVTYGSPQRPPLLFLHGVRLAGSIWAEHARRLCQQYYVVTPDLPGHGALAHLPFEAPILEAFLAHLTDGLFSAPPLVIGYSLGGYLAMRYALDNPERTAGLLLTGCSADIVGLRRRMYDLAVLAGSAVPPAAIDQTLATLFRLTMPRHLAEQIIPFPFNRGVFAASRRIACGQRYSTHLRAYRKPVLLVNGQWDVLFRRDEARYAKNARAGVHILRGATHIAPMSRVQEFTDVVRSFAGTVFPAQ